MICFALMPYWGASREACIDGNSLRAIDGEYKNRGCREGSEKEGRWMEEERRADEEKN